MIKQVTDIPFVKHIGIENKMLNKVKYFHLIAYVLTEILYNTLLQNLKFNTRETDETIRTMGKGF